MPSCDLGDLLVTNWAQTALLFPKMEKPLFPCKGIYHFHVETFFIVAFPFRVIRVGLSTDLCVSLDWHMHGVCEIMRLLFCSSVEHPIVSCDGLEVFLRDPFISLSWVSPFHPSPYRSIDFVVYFAEGFFAHNVPVIERPSPNDGVKLYDQFSGTESFIGPHDVPSLFQESVNILFRRLDQQFVPFPRLVLAYVLAQEVESLSRILLRCA